MSEDYLRAHHPTADLERRDSVSPGVATGLSLLVVVVNFRTPDLTVTCLGSLSKEIPVIPGARVVVVDNDSADGSAEHINAAIDSGGWRPWAELLSAGHNGGFAFGTNRGVESVAGARYFLFLNSDTIVLPGSLSYCVAAMDADPRLGAMSCMVLNSDGTVQNVARRFPTPLRRVLGALGLPWRWPRIFGWADTDDLRWDRRTTKRDVDWLGGAFLLVRGDLVPRIGSLDEDFFFYGEDVEFCHRVWRAGYRCRYDPAVAVVHHGGRSSDPSRISSEERIGHSWRARHLVHLKLYGPASASFCLAIDKAVLALRLALLAGTGRRTELAFRQAEQVLRLLGGRDALVPYRPTPAAPVATAPKAAK